LNVIDGTTSSAAYMSGIGIISSTSIEAPGVGFQNLWTPARRLFQNLSPSELRVFQNLSPLV